MTRARLLAIGIGIALGLLAAEGLFPALYPRRNEAHETRFWKRLLRLDPELGYRLRRNVSLSWTDQLGDGSQGKTFTTNAAGRRAKEYRGEGSLGKGNAMRIALLGDSSTMGFYMRDHEHFAARLGPRLSRVLERPLTIENHAVIGYTSRQGFQQWRRDLSPRPPDVLVWALGYNDSFLSFRDEQSWYDAIPSRVWLPFHELLQPHSNVYEAFFRLTHRERGHARAYPREARSRYEQRLRDLARQTKERGTRLVLFELMFPNAYLHQMNLRLARELNLTYVDARQLLEQELRETGTPFLPFELQPTPGDAITLTFHPEDGARPALCMIDLRDQARTPYCVPFEDDGIAPDQEAGDGIYTLGIPCAGQTGRVEFAIVRAERLARDPLHVNGRLFRTLSLGPGLGFTSPTWTWNHWTEGIREYMRPDEFIHPNAQGHELIARGLARLLAEFD